MDPEFTAYLIEKGIDVNEFKAATIGEKGTILTAFESSKKGNLFQHICWLKHFTCYRIYSALNPMSLCLLSIAPIINQFYFASEL